MFCIISDIDGTLANCDHRRHHVEGKKKDWDAFFAEMGDDAPKYKVINTYHALLKIGGIEEGILCTGRFEKDREKTQTWLEENFVSYEHLLMRKDGDFRPDEVVKEEMLDQLLALGYEPYLVLDDRDKVVKMWRSRGLTCLQVAEGDF